VVSGSAAKTSSKGAQPQWSGRRRPGPYVVTLWLVLRGTG
jgi:hypothetical protein